MYLNKLTRSDGLPKLASSVNPGSEFNARKTETLPELEKAIEVIDSAYDELVPRVRKHMESILGKSEADF